MSKCDHERKNIDIESLNERVRQAGMKLTVPRMQVLQTLVARPQPISADDIFKKFEGQADSMDLVTIYRVLKKFEEGGIVTRQEFGDGVARFELVLESGHHHHHVICRSCNNVEVIHLCNLEPHIKAVQDMGYKQLSHRLDFFGICSKCQ